MPRLLRPPWEEEAHGHDGGRHCIFEAGVKRVVYLLVQRQWTYLWGECGSRANGPRQVSIKGVVDTASSKPV